MIQNQIVTSGTLLSRARVLVPGAGGMVVVVDIRPPCRGRMSAGSPEGSRWVNRSVFAAEAWSAVCHRCSMIAVTLEQGGF